MNRLELVGKTLRAALNAVAVVAPDWLRTIAPPAWHERYDRRVEEGRLRIIDPKREACVAQVGADGFLLLGALDAGGAPEGVIDFAEFMLLRRVWARQFECIEPSEDGNGGGVRPRAVQGRGPGNRVDFALRRRRALPLEAGDELDAPGAPSRPHENRPSVDRDRCSHQPRPSCRMARRPPARPDPHLTLHRVCCLTSPIVSVHSRG